MEVAVLGIDLGKKNICSLTGFDGCGKVTLRRRMKRDRLPALAERLPPCVVAMEACCGAHHIERIFAAWGHEVRLMSPEYFRPYVKAQKNGDHLALGRDRQKTIASSGPRDYSCRASSIALIR
jgi:transposase